MRTSSFAKTATILPHLCKSRMCRLPCMVPRMMYSDTRWRAVTCSLEVKDDSRQPFTE